MANDRPGPNEEMDNEDVGRGRSEEDVTGRAPDEDDADDAEEFEDIEEAEDEDLE